MRDRIKARAEKYNQRYIVAGPHWSWGWGYSNLAEARQVLSKSQPGFGYTRCQCGAWVAGLIEANSCCANCT